MVTGLAKAHRRQKGLEQQVEEGFVQEQVVAPKTGFEHATDRVQSILGNTWMNAALSGESMTSFDLAIMDTVALASIGVDEGVLPAEGSMQAMRDAMKEALPDARDPRISVIGQGGGNPLPPEILARMERAFGHDFSHVRIHTGAQVASAAEALNAHAFAIGPDIYFGGGELAPGTAQGDHLLAHELQHIVQADEGRLPGASGPGLSVSSPTDVHEVEAERVAGEVVGELSVGLGTDAHGSAAMEPGLGLGAASGSALASDQISLNAVEPSTAPKDQDSSETEDGGDSDVNLAFVCYLAGKGAGPPKILGDFSTGSAKVTTDVAESILKNMADSGSGFKPELGKGGASWFISEGDPHVGIKAQSNVGIDVKIDTSSKPLVIGDAELKDIYGTIEKQYTNNGSLSMEQAAAERYKNFKGIKGELTKSQKRSALKALKTAIESKMWDVVGGKAKSSPSGMVQVVLNNSEFSLGGNGKILAVADGGKIQIPGGMKSVINSLEAAGGKVEPYVREAAERLHGKLGVGGKLLSVVKWGGRVLLVVAISADVIKIIYAEDRYKETVKVAGGWAGGAFAAGAVEFFWPANFAGPLGTVAYVVVIFAAGGVGYLIGSETAGAVYELVVVDENASSSSGSDGSSGTSQSADTGTSTSTSTDGSTVTDTSGGSSSDGTANGTSQGHETSSDPGIGTKLLAGGPLEAEQETEAVAAPGSPLQGPVKDQMEGAFGADLSAVRIHTGADAAGQAASLGAKAFTQGSDITFGAGQFDPGSPGGQELLAHELTHTLQQLPGEGVTSPSDAVETEADKVAKAVLKGGQQNDGSIAETVAAVVERGTGGQGTARKVARKGGGTAAVTGFIGKKPTQQARGWKSLGAETKAGLDGDLADVKGAVPTLHVVLGKGAQPDQNQKKPADTSAKTPGMAVPKGQDAPPPRQPATNMPPAPRAVPPDFSRMPADATTEQKQAAGKKALAAIPTSMNGVPTSPGTAPKVPLTGDRDPKVTEKSRADAKRDADDARMKARQEVENGRGPEVIKPKILDEVVEMPELTATIEAVEPAPVEAMDKFIALNMPAEVDAALDEQQQAVFDASLAEARTKADEALTTKDADQAAALTKAEADAKKLTEGAEKEQQDALAKARGDIDTARKDTLAQQDKAVSDLEKQAGDKQKSEVDAIKARVAADEGKIEGEYTKAETDVARKIKDGEKEASTAKADAEKKAEDKSWWDKVKDAVSSAFKAITDAINKVISAVRDAVGAILDAVKSLANKVIDAACKWVTDKIRAFGEWLKTQVTALLGTLFPKLAAKLNALIDGAVDWTCKKVEQVASALKKGIAAVCDAIAAALDKLIAIYQAAINFALTLIEAALTGDWSKVGKMVLDAVLKLAGIPPEEFYAVLAKAESTIDVIVEDPGAFVGHLADAAKQGFGQFGDNFLTHLKDGFIMWLTQTTASAGVATLGSLDLKDIFSFCLDTLGINKQYIKEKAVKTLGAENVERIEWVMGVVGTALEGGWDGLWEYMQGFADGFYDLVIGKIQNFIMTRIIQAAVIKIASMFNPVGAIVQAVITAWNLYTFMRDQIKRIWGVVSAIVDSIADIAAGSIGSAANLIEGALARLVPIAIDLLAKLLNIGGITDKVKEVITNVREKIDKAIDAMVDKIKGLFKGKGGPGGKDEKDKKVDDKDKNKGVPELPTERYTDAEGKDHRLFLDASGGTPKLMRASTPEWMDSYLKKDGISKEEGAALKLSHDIDILTKEFVVLKKKETRTPEEDKRIAAIVADVKSQLALLRAEMEKTQGADPELMKLRLEFEQKLGAKASSDGRATAMADTFCKQSWALCKAYATKTTATAEEYTAAMTKLAEGVGKPLDAGFFGAVGNTVKDIENCVNSGDFRQKYLVGYNFQDVWGPRVFEQDEAWLRTVLAEANGKLAEIKAKPIDVEKTVGRRKTVEETGAPKTTKGLLGSGKEMHADGYDNEDFRAAKFTSKDDGLKGMDDKLASVPLEVLTDEQLRFFCRQRKLDESGSHDELVARLNKAGVYETGVGPSNPMARSQIRKDDPTLAAGGEEKGTGPGDATVYHQFLQGNLANIVDEKHWWVKGARSLTMPIKAGVSGTTQRYMQFAATVGAQPMNHVRLMLLGALIPTHAHSFHEIMTSAQGFPGCRYAEGSYTDVAPWSKTELVAIAGSEEAYVKICYKKGDSTGKMGGG